MSLGASPLGIEIPFTKLLHYQTPFTTQQNTLTISLNDTTIRNLERVIFIFRHKESCSNTAYRDTYMFRNGSTTFIPDVASEQKSAYSLGCCPYSSQLVASNMAGSLTTGTGYTGIWNVQARYMGETLPSETPFLIAPYNFGEAKTMFAGCFGDPKETHVSKYLYEGIDQFGIWQNCTPQFCFALDLRCVAGAEGAGISLAKGSLDISFQLAGAHLARDDAIQVDYFLLVGAVHHITTSKTWIDT
jgi:hypothetical protein